MRRWSNKGYPPPRRADSESESGESAESADSESPAPESSSVVVKE